jgi:ankyrin repeat protein
MVDLSFRSRVNISAYSLQAPDVNASPSREKQLRQAALCGNIARVTELLATPGICVNAANWMGYTSLVSAARRGDLELVRNLLQGFLSSETHVKAADERHGDTAMIWAAGGNNDMVRALLAVRGINVHAMNAVGWVSEVTIGFL